MKQTELFEIALGEALGRSERLSEAVLRTPGSVGGALLHAVASVAAELAFDIETRHADLYLDTAGGDALSRLAFDRWGLTRHGATVAVGEVAFTRTSTVGPIALDVGTVVRTPAGQRFALDAPCDMPIGDAGPVTVPVTSVLAGPDQNVAAGSIDRLEAGSPQADLTITQAARTTGGNEAEREDAFRARVRAAWLAQRRATLGAIVQGALAVPQVREAAAAEALDPGGRPSGSVSLVVADQDGYANGALAAATVTAMEDWRAAGVAVTVVEGAPVQVDVAVHIRWAVGAATAANRTAVRDAIVGVINRLGANGATTAAEAPPESLLTPGLVEAAARSVRGVVGVTVDLPVGTVAPGHGEILRTSPARVRVL